MLSSLTLIVRQAHYKSEVKKLSGQKFNERLRKHKFEVVEFAKTFLGAPYSQEFNCFDFIQQVYGQFGIAMPRKRHAVSISDFENPEAVGKMLYLKRKGSERRITHLAIYIGNYQVIHNSFYFGEKVSITSLDKLLEVYEIV